MKKTLLSLFALAISSVAMAQHPQQGTVSIVPRIGLSIANLSGDEIIVDGNYTLSSRYRTSFMGGVDLDYQFLPDFSVTLGAYYAQQGCNYKNSFEEKHSGTTLVGGTGYSDMSTQLHYINVPLTLNAYLAPGFALKAGVKFGFAMSGKMKYVETIYTKDNEGEMKPSKPEDRENNLNSTMKKMCMSIPVGLSYEFADVIIDARYNIGLTPFQEVGGYKGPKNRVFTLSAGYRFKL